MVKLLWDVRFAERIRDCTTLILPSPSLPLEIYLRSGYPRQRDGAYAHCCDAQLPDYS